MGSGFFYPAVGRVRVAAYNKESCNKDSTDKKHFFPNRQFIFHVKLLRNLNKSKAFYPHKKE
jgi:hypothetical protein